MPCCRTHGRQQWPSACLPRRAWVARALPAEDTSDNGNWSSYRKAQLETWFGHSSEMKSHHLPCKRGKTKPLPTSSTCTPGSVVSAPLCSSDNSTTLTGLCDTHSHAPFRHKSLFFALNANTKDWSDIEPDTLTNSCLPQPEYDQFHGALLFRYTESNFGDTANFEVNALYRDACSSSNEGRWSSQR